MVLADGTMEPASTAAPGGGEAPPAANDLPGEADGETEHEPLRRLGSQTAPLTNVLGKIPKYWLCTGRVTSNQSDVKIVYFKTSRLLINSRCNIFPL